MAERLTKSYKETEQKLADVTQDLTTSLKEKYDYADSQIRDYVNSGSAAGDLEKIQTAGKYTFDSCLYTYKHVISPCEETPEDHQTRLAVGMTTLGVALTVDSLMFGSAGCALLGKGILVKASSKIADELLNTKEPQEKKVEK